MKKLKFTMAMALSVMIGFAQPYGEIKYNNGSTMTSAGRTQIHSPGFIMAGMISGSHVRFDKTDAGGVFNMFGNNFQRDYYLAVGASCTGVSHDYVSTIAGVSVVETQGISMWYAMAGAYDEACFLTLAASNGQPVLTGIYPFPYVSSNISKPCIIQAQNKDFYICGKFDTSMYVLRVDTAGTVKWSSFYSAGHTMSGTVLTGGGIFLPHDIIESPFNNDVVIVGMLTGAPSYNRASDGFFLTLNETTGGVNIFESYGDYVSTSAPNNEFYCVRPALSNLGGQGYVISGYSDYYNTTPANTGHSWVLKLDVSGNGIWNRIFTATSDPVAGQARGVVERKVPGGTYEYYVVCQTNITVTDGILVLKLGNTGLPIHVTQPAKNSEFYYPQATPFFPVGITESTGAGSGNGLHMYVNDGSDHYLYQTYFNGVEGCGEVINNIMAYENGPTNISPWINTYGSLSLCSDGAYDMGTDNYTPTQVCLASSIPGGSNAKTTGGITQLPGSFKTQVYPNPGMGNYTIDIESQAQIIIYNAIGEVIYKDQLTAGSNKIDITQYENGLYLVKVFDNYKEETFQVIKN